VPWNVPQFLIMPKLIPALIAGCTVVVKPAPETPLDAMWLAEMLDEIDLPEIIRDSSGALTSDTVQGARIRSAAADQAVGRVRDRFLSRRNGRRLQGQWSGPGDVLPGTTAGPPELPTAPAPEHP